MPQVLVYHLKLYLHSTSHTVKKTLKMMYTLEAENNTHTSPSLRPLITPPSPLPHPEISTHLAYRNTGDEKEIINNITTVIRTD